MAKVKQTPSRPDPPREFKPAPLAATPAQKFPGQVFHEIVCPYCGASKPRVIATRPGVERLYECRNCRMFDTDQPTAFRVPSRKPAP